MIGNIVTGIVGAIISGLLFDWLNVIDIGDLFDPLIAGALGAAILLAVTGAFRPAYRASTP